MPSSRESSRLRDQTSISSVSCIGRQFLYRYHHLGNQCRRHKRHGFDTGGGHSNSLQYSCLENPMHRGTWQATVHEVTKSHTQPKQLSKHKQKMQPKDAGPCRPGLARWHHSREPTYRCKINRRWLDLWIGKILWSRKWQPTPVFLPGESPWTEEPGGLQSMGSQREHNEGDIRDASRPGYSKGR